MNHKIVSYMVGRILQIEALLLVLPLAVSLIYKENCSMAFLITILIAVAIGILLTKLFGKNDKMIFAKEGFAIVALAWIAMSLIGALPFYISKEIPSYVDAFFETVSGFTTTGASILPEVESMSRSLLFWRSFTHWLGGMGVLVFVMAIFPQESGRSIHIMRAEMPGPSVGKLVPRIRETAKLLYVIYIVMTAIQVVLLLVGGMPLFDSLLHSFGTAGTGGFGIKNDSITSYNSYLQWVIAIFMVLFGVNFNLYYLILIKRFKAAIKSTELWVYLGIIAFSTILISANIFNISGSISETVRTAFFQVSSIITTTGYATTDFNLWPNLSKTILVILMFIGACAGSTGGGLKVSRIVIAIKTIFKDIKRMLHPRSVGSVKFEGKAIDAQTTNGVSVYFAIYFILFFAILFLLSFETAETFDFETNFTAAAACFNNIGPGLAGVGPASNFGAYSSFSKIVLSIAMLLGRLEIFPILLVFTPVFWKRK